MINIHSLIRIIRSHAYINKIASYLFNAFNKNRYHIMSDNIVIKDCVYLKQVNIIIKGRKNVVKINKNSYLNNCKIYISGNKNMIILANNSNFLNAELYI